MHCQSFRLGSAFILSVFLTFMPSMAWAYIDPNAAGFLFQLLFPIITAIAAVFVFLRQKVMDMFKGFSRLWQKDRTQSKD